MGFEEKVKKIAYELYEKNGRQEGHDLLDWLAAEQIIRFQQMIFSGMSGADVDLLEYKPMSDPRRAPTRPVKPGTRSRKRFGVRRPEAAEKVL